MFAVEFDRASVKISDKIWNLTLGLVRKVLENAGLDEGGWYLKVPHRVRKKGHERFKVLRLDDRVGAKGIRIRCKPQGNETSFEYTLVPPEGINLNDLFILLQRVNPKTLEIHDTLALKAAIESTEYRGIDFPVTRAIVDNIYRKIKSEPEKITNLSPADSSSAADPVDAPVKAADAPVDANEAASRFNPPRPFNSPRPKPLEWVRAQKKTDENKEESISLKEIARNISPVEDKIEKIHSLALTEPTLLGDQEVLDRALVAMSFVTTEGYCARLDASNSIIKNLDILNFIENVSQGAYNAIESAMRSLTMALRKNNYIERVYYGKSEGVRGYKFTPKAEKRIIALQKFLDDNILSQINPSWSKFTKQEEFIEDSGQNETDVEITETPNKDISPMSVRDVSSEAVREAEAETEHYSRLESLISELRDLNDQIVEADGFINNLNSEKTDLQAELYGIEKAIEEQIRCKEEIEKRINKFQEKQKEMKDQIENKEREILDWQRFQLPCVTEKDKIKKQMENLANDLGIGLRAST